METIRSILHPWVIHAAKLARDKKYRRKSERILIGGLKVVREQLAHQNPKWKRVATTERFRDNHNDLASLFANANLHINIDERCCQHITREATPDGIIAELNMPKLPKADLSSASNSKCLALLEPSLPLNLGSIVRTAVALGWANIVLVGDAADPLSYECIRSSKGAVFGGAYHFIKSPNDLQKYLENNRIEPILASSHSECGHIEGHLMFSRPLTSDIKRTQKWALVLGNEAHGFKKLPNTEYWKGVMRASIPFNNCNVESLNLSVAAGILMHSLNYSVCSDSECNKGSTI